MKNLIYKKDLGDKIDISKLEFQVKKPLIMAGKQWIGTGPIKKGIFIDGKLLLTDTER